MTHPSTLAQLVNDITPGWQRRIKPCTVEEIQQTQHESATNPPAEPARHRKIIEESEWLGTFGWPHDRIADRLNITPRELRIILNRDAA
jgi:hypothetical protein